MPETVEFVFKLLSNITTQHITGLPSNNWEMSYVSGQLYSSLIRNKSFYICVSFLGSFQWTIKYFNSIVIHDWNVLALCNHTIWTGRRICYATCGFIVSCYDIIILSNNDFEIQTKEIIIISGIRFKFNKCSINRNKIRFEYNNLNEVKLSCYTQNKTR